MCGDNNNYIYWYIIKFRGFYYYSGNSGWFNSKHVMNLFLSRTIKCTNAPPNSLMDLTTSPKVKTTEGKGIGARSPVHNTLGVKGRARALGWD